VLLCVIVITEFSCGQLCAEGLQNDGDSDDGDDDTGDMNDCECDDTQDDNQSDIDDDDSDDGDRMDSKNVDKKNDQGLHGILVIHTSVVFKFQCLHSFFEVLAL
jgi:hypothetical protein